MQTVMRCKVLIVSLQHSDLNVYICLFLFFRHGHTEWSYRQFNWFFQQRGLDSSSPQCGRCYSHHQQRQGQTHTADVACFSSICYFLLLNGKIKYDETNREESSIMGLWCDTVFLKLIYAFFNSFLHTVASGCSVIAIKDGWASGSKMENL